jgi:hypothetical protein
MGTMSPVMIHIVRDVNGQDCKLSIYEWVTFAAVA